jgi:hypothetical protein
MSIEIVNNGRSILKTKCQNFLGCELINRFVHIWRSLRIITNRIIGQFFSFQPQLLWSWGLANRDVCTWEMSTSGNSWWFALGGDATGSTSDDQPSRTARVAWKHARERTRDGFGVLEILGSECYEPDITWYQVSKSSSSIQQAFLRAQAKDRNFCITYNCVKLWIETVKQLEGHNLYTQSPAASATLDQREL